jgi:hypothetical protein
LVYFYCKYHPLPLLPSPLPPPFNTFSHYHSLTYYITKQWGTCATDNGFLQVLSNSDTCLSYYFPSLTTYPSPNIITFSPNSTNTTVKYHQQADTLVIWADVADIGMQKARRERGIVKKGEEMGKREKEMNMFAHPSLFYVAN